MNYYRNFYGQNNVSGNSMPNGMNMPAGMNQFSDAPCSRVIEPMLGRGMEVKANQVESGEMPTTGIEPPIGEVPVEGVTPELPQGIVPPIGEVPVEGVTPELPQGIVPPIGELPIEGITPELPQGIVPPIGTVTGPTGPTFPTFPSNTVQFQLRNCLNNLVIVRTRNGDLFWYFPTRLDSTRVYGYRWGWQSGWYLFDMPYTNIMSVFCYVM